MKPPTKKKVSHAGATIEEGEKVRAKEAPKEPAKPGAAKPAGGAGSAPTASTKG